MILFVAAGAWLTALVVVSFASPLTLPARRQMQTDLAGIGVVIAATLGFFWRLVFTANVWIPAGGGDLAGFLYPTYQFAAEWWRRGVIPLWNPYLFAGQPFVGDIQSGIFYPLNLLTFLISSPFSYRDLELLSVIHYMIAGIGMYVFLRWGNFRGTTPFHLPSGEKEAEGQVAPSKPHLSRAACLAGALAFEFSDLFITHFGNLNLIATAAWLPLVFLFFMRGVDQAIETRAQPLSRPLAEVPPRIRPAPSEANPSTGSGHAPVESRSGRSQLAASWVAVNSITPSIVSGIFLAVAFLAGHIQSFLFILLALGMYAVYRVVESRRSALRVLAALGVTLVVGLGLSALVLVPSVEMSRASVRSSFTYEDAAQFSLPPAELVGLFVPGFFGRGPEAAWGPWPRVEVGYLGIFPLILAGLAVVLRWDSKTFFFILLALAGLILALGGYAIVHGWLYAFVPGFGQLRAPARFILLVDFGLAASAAIGFDTLVQPLTGSRQQTFHRIMRSAPWALLLVALASGSVAGSILILGQGQDPVLFGRIANAANALAFFILLLALSTALLKARQGNLLSIPIWSAFAIALVFFDLSSLGAYVDIGLSDPTAAYNRQDIRDFLRSQAGTFRIDSRTNIGGTWLPDTALLYGLFDVNGDNPLILSEFDRYWESLGSRAVRAYDLLNIRYVLARHSTPLDKNFQPVFDGASGITVYKNLNALPRAWIVYASHIAPNHASAMEQLYSPQFDPRGTAIVEGNLAQELPDAHVLSDDAQVVGYGPNEVDLQVTAKQQGYLILSEVYFPGWRVFVDDRETQVVPADYLFRAVLLPPGAHQVRFVYDPLSFKLGAAISGLTLLGLMGWAAYARGKGLLRSL